MSTLYIAWRVSITGAQNKPLATVLYTGDHQPLFKLARRLGFSDMRQSCDGIDDLLLHDPIFGCALRFLPVGYRPVDHGGRYLVSAIDAKIDLEIARLQDMRRNTPRCLDYRTWKISIKKLDRASDQFLVIPDYVSFDEEIIPEENPDLSHLGEFSDLPTDDAIDHWKHEGRIHRDYQFWNPAYPLEARIKDLRMAGMAKHDARLTAKQYLLDDYYTHCNYGNTHSDVYLTVYMYVEGVQLTSDSVSTDSYSLPWQRIEMQREMLALLAYWIETKSIELSATAQKLASHL